MAGDDRGTSGIAIAMHASAPNLIERFENAAAAERLVAELRTRDTRLAV